MTTKRITSGEEWKYRNGEGALLIRCVYCPCPVAAIPLTAPSEVFVEIHNRLDEDIRLHAIVGDVPFFNYSSDAPGNRMLLGNTSEFNERIAAGERFDVKVGLNSPDVEELTFVISSVAGTLRKRKFKVKRYD